MPKPRMGQMIETGRGVPVSGRLSSRHQTHVPCQMEHNDMAQSPTELLVCVKCRRGEETPKDDRWPGERLFDALTAIGAPDGVDITPVACLQNCSQGCSVALRGGNRWTYVYGNVDEVSHPDTLIEGVAQYHATNDGLIPWRTRSELFKRNCIARIPPLTPQEA